MVGDCTASGDRTGSEGPGTDRKVARAEIAQRYAVSAARRITRAPRHRVCGQQRERESPQWRALGSAQARAGR